MGAKRAMRAIEIALPGICIGLSPARLRRRVQRGGLAGNPSSKLAMPTIWVIAWPSSDKGRSSLSKKKDRPCPRLK